MKPKDKIITFVIRLPEGINEELKKVAEEYSKEFKYRISKNELIKEFIKNGLEYKKGKK